MLVEVWKGMIFMTSQKKTVEDLNLVIEKILNDYEIVHENYNFSGKTTKMKCVSDFFYVYNADAPEEKVVKLSSNTTNRTNKCYYTRLNLIKNFPELSSILDINKPMVCDKCTSICLMKFVEEGGRLRLKPKLKKPKLKKF